MKSILEVAQSIKGGWAKVSDLPAYVVPGPIRPYEGFIDYVNGLRLAVFTDLHKEVSGAYIEINEALEFHLYTIDVKDGEQWVCSLAQVLNSDDWESRIYDIESDIIRAPFISGRIEGGMVNLKGESIQQSSSGEMIVAVTALEVLADVLGIRDTAGSIGLNHLTAQSPVFKVESCLKYESHITGNSIDLVLNKVETSFCNFSAEFSGQSHRLWCPLYKGYVIGSEDDFKKALPLSHLWDLAYLYELARPLTTVITTSFEEQESPWILDVHEDMNHEFIYHRLSGQSGLITDLFTNYFKKQI